LVDPFPNNLHCAFQSLIQSPTYTNCRIRMPLSYHEAEPVVFQAKRFRFQLGPLRAKILSLLAMYDIVLFALVDSLHCA
jgi:hypothetical protein